MWILRYGIDMTHCSTPTFVTAILVTFLASHMPQAHACKLIDYENAGCRKCSETETVITGSCKDSGGGMYVNYETQDFCMCDFHEDGDFRDLNALAQASCACDLCYAGLYICTQPDEQ
jgi:hypothetical protein